MKLLHIGQWLSLTVIFTFTSLPSLAGDPLLLGVPQFKPFTFIKDGKLKGTAIGEIERILKSSNIDYQFTFIANYTLLMKAVRDKKIDGFFLASQNIERDRHAVFSKPVLIDHFSWFVLHNAPYELGTEEFKRYAKVGAIARTNSFRLATRQGYQVYGQQLPLLAQQFINQNLDAVFATEKAFLFELNSIDFPKLNYRVVQDSERPFGIYISKFYIESHPNFMENLNQHIKTVDIQ